MADDFLSASLALTAICRALHEVIIADRTMRSHHPGTQAYLGATIEHLENDALAIINKTPGIAARHRNIILKSLSAKLAVMSLDDAPAGISPLTKEDWRSLIVHMTPDEIQIFISKGLGIADAHVTIYRFLETHCDDAETANAIAEIIGNMIGPVEFDCDDDSNGFWNSNWIYSIKSPLLAPYLRAQVANFPDEIRDMLEYSNSLDMFPIFLIAHLAGLPMSDWDTSDPASPLISKLINLASSNHGCMHIQATFGSIESVLADPVAATNAALARL
jgi:hypothetical protein